MPSSVSFIGSGFYVASATQVASGTVRVKFSSAPKAVSSVGVNDALNPVNYVLSGPGPYSIVSVQTVSGDPLSFDIVLAAAFVQGTWIVQVSNVQTVASNPLTAPTAAQFQVTTSASASSLTGGAQDDDAEKIIRKHLSTALKGENWDALIKALSVGDDINWNNARAAFDQLFITTASGSYLERKAGDMGLIKPLGVGIDDESFRKLAVKTNANKVVHEAIREILEVYFGQDALRAFVEAELDEKYNLSGGSQTLTWTLDEKEEFSHTFLNAEFGAAATAKAVEVAFALTKVMRDAGSKGFASVFLSPLTGKNRVRIYSGSLGLGSFVRVTGGTAQNVFHFPTLLSTYSGAVAGYSWTVTAPDADTTRFSLTLTSPLIDLSDVQVGDYVIIGSDAQIGTTGSFAIKNVVITWNTPTNTTQSFDIERIAFTGTAIQTSNTAYTFYRPTKNSISAANGRTVVVAQTRPGQIDISIPATTAIVSRGPNQAFYGRVNASIDIVSIKRDAAGLVTITTAAPHGLLANHQVQIDDVVPAPGIPYITPGNGATFPSAFQFAAGITSIVAESQTPPGTATASEDAAVTTLSNGQILFAGGFTRAAGTITNSTGFQASGAVTASQTANRYVPGSTAVITDATEADGAIRSSHTWVSTADMNFIREHSAMSAYGTGAINSGGMVTAPFSILSSAEQYQLDSVWLNLPAMTVPRAGHCQVTRDDGTVFAVGGARGEGTATRTTDVYNGTVWAAGPQMQFPRTDFQLVKLSNGDYMAIGGRTLGTSHTSDSRTLALWRMDEAAGPTSPDETTAYPLTYSSPSAPISTLNGKINRCLDFSTATTKLTGTGNVAAQQACLGEWTIEFWHKQSAVSADPREFVTYGGPTGTAADNILLNVGMSDAGRIFWRWENGTGSAVTQGSTFTWPSTAIVNSQQTDPIITHPIWRVNFFNHIALRKSFFSPQKAFRAHRASNVVTLDFETPHGFVNGDAVYFMSSDRATALEITDGYVPFSSGLFTITASTSTTISFSNTGANISARQLFGSFVGKTFNVTLFVNGVQIQQWTNLANASGGPTTGNAWYVAHNPEISSSGCEGFLDDMRISKAARTEEEIRSNFLKGWGHQRSLGQSDQVIGAVTDTCEILSGGVWTLTGSMSIGRGFHRAVVLPGDYVLVTGGVGYDPSMVPPIANQATVGLWPNNSLSQAEIYDPTVKRWFPVKPAGVRRHGHAAYYLPTLGKVLVFGGSSFNMTPADTDDAGFPELYDVATRTWRTMPVKYRTAAGAIAAANINDRETLIYGGFDQTGLTNSKALLYVNGSSIVTGPGFNAQHTVYAVPSSTTLQIQTQKTPEEIGYTSTFGPRFLGEDGSWNQARVGGTWNISTGVRTSNITTLTLTFPTGYIAHNIAVGSNVYVNSRTGAFGGGLKTVTAVSATTISYAEAASNQGVISVVGSVSEDWSTDAHLVPIAAVAGQVNDPGPFIFDPLNGLAVTATESTIVTAPLFANQHYEEVEIADSGGQGSAFPDAVGYIVFNFGTDSQSSPVKYLGRYKSSPSTAKLTLDYAYKFTADQPIGTTVTFLSQRAPYAPIASKGSAYTTSSSAGRIAAQAATEEALAAGINLDVTVVYPGDRGLGGEGFPSHGAQKLSDKVAIFAGDDINEELQGNRED